MKKRLVSTPIGEMIAVGDEERLFLLDFADRPGLPLRLDKLGSPAFGMTPPLISIEMELAAYFEKTLKVFKTPIGLNGTPFQQRVWNALQEIPYGETRSYKAQAAAVGYPAAYRAVANGNNANRLSVIVPCHRVISSSNLLSGYGGGVERKRWLLAHEGVSCR